MVEDSNDANRVDDSLKFSLRALLGLVAYFAVLAWGMALMGPASVDFWMANAASFLAMCGLVAMARSERGRRYAILPSALLVFAIGFAGSGTTIVVSGAALLFIGGLILAGQPRQRLPRLLGLGLFCHALAIACGVCPALFVRREWFALHREFPVESLARRLDYEASGTANPGAAMIRGNSSAAERLARLDSLYAASNYRETRLRQLHLMRYENFVRAAGFGVGRFVAPRRNTLAWPPLRDIASAAPISDPERESRSHFPDELGDLSTWETLHQRSSWNFLEPPSLGTVFASRERVAGFIPHAFQSAPAAWKPVEVGEVRRLQLVSLLKFDSPRVYVLDHLPRMDQLSSRDAPTRPLNDFETTAVERLRNSWDDLVVEERNDEIRMVGALRAVRKCQECHRVEYGELLGAFSYSVAPR